jgi:hypothetical protein
MHALCASMIVATIPSVAHSEAATAKDSKAEKIICKRSTVTGSWAQTNKLCGTRQWWEERTRRSKEWTQDILDNSRKAPIPIPE